MLKKELTLFNVYAIATGTTLSAGFFLLPGIAFNEAGPAVVLSYLIAAIPLIPAMFSMVELAKNSANLRFLMKRHLTRSYFAMSLMRSTLILDYRLP